MEGLVKTSADVSLKVQIIAGILTYFGTNTKVAPKDTTLSLGSANPTDDEIPHALRRELTDLGLF